jgi:hypothetical protein
MIEETDQNVPRGSHEYGADVRECSFSCQYDEGKRKVASVDKPFPGRTPATLYAKVISSGTNRTYLRLKAVSKISFH